MRELLEKRNLGAGINFFSVQKRFEEAKKPKVTLSPSTSLVVEVVEEKRPLPRVKSELVMGTINQFSDPIKKKGLFSKRCRETCPSTTLAFISRFLNHGLVGLDQEMVNKVIRVGQERFVRLSATREKQKANMNIPRELLEETRGIRMSVFEALPAYEGTVGKRPKSPEAFVLHPDNKFSAKELPRERVKQLMGIFKNFLIPHSMENKHRRAAATFTINGQTLGIGVQVRDNEAYTVLFDSHGQMEKKISITMDLL